MTAVRCLYESPAAACKQMKRYLADRGLNMVCRSHTHRKSDTSRWYVMATSDWPPFSHAVLLSDLDPLNEDMLRIGAAVFRGVATGVQGQLTKPAGKSLVMQRHWRWRDIIAEHESELFVEPLVTAAATTTNPLILQIATRELEPDIGSDPYDGKGEWERMCLHLDRSGSLELSVETTGKALKPLQKCKDIDQLADALRKLQPSDWSWYEVLAYQDLKPEQQAGKPAAKEPLITTHELYESLLAPFETWLFE